MKIQCPKCGKFLTVPESYEGRKILCGYCKEVIVIIKPVENPLPKSQNTHPSLPVVPLEKLLTKEKQPYKNILEKFYSGIPAPFKISFFATIGVISALLLCFYVYSNFIIKNPLNSLTSLSKNNFDNLKNSLFSEDLFLYNSIGEKTILRGRPLIAYTFLPDAAEPDNFLKIYFDDENKLCAISACWIADHSGFYPLDYLDHPKNYIFENDEFYLLRASKIISSFKKLTNFNPVVPNFRYMINSNELRDENKDWKFELCRTESWIKSNNAYVQKCKKEKTDPNIYLYISIARNW